MLGKVLCLLGLHSYEWRTELQLDPVDDMHVFKDQYRCKRVGCPESHFWHVANVEARKPW